MIKRSYQLDLAEAKLFFFDLERATQEDYGRKKVWARRARLLQCFRAFKMLSA